MSSLFVRTLALLVHAVASLLFINWLLNFDLTGRWAVFTGFILLLLVLLYLFIKHVFSYYYFIKTKTK